MSSFASHYLLHLSIFRILILSISWGLTSLREIDVLSFEFQLKNVWVQDYNLMTKPVSLALKTAIENKLSEILITYSSEDFDGADVVNFRNRQGHVVVSCDITYSTALEETKESLIVFHIRTLLAEAGWKIPTDQGLADIDVIYYYIKKTDSTPEVVPIVLNNASKCAIYESRGVCRNGGRCNVQADTPVCWCPINYIGAYCEELYTPVELGVKLVGGGYSWGLLEVSSIEGTGVVCASDWDTTTIQVTCRQLGFQGGHRVTLPDTPRSSAETVLLNRVKCYGNETNLGWCLHSHVRQQRCPTDQHLVIYCSDITDVMTVSLTFGEKLREQVKNSKLGKKKRDLRSSLSAKLNIMYGSIQDFSYADVISISEVSGGVRADVQLMYNHRMEPTRQAMALYSLAKVIKDHDAKLSLDDFEEDFKVTGFHLTNTNNKFHTRMNVALLDQDVCALFHAKSVCLNGGACEVLDKTPFCKCPDGFMGAHCEEDIDECSRNSDCAHDCENVIGGYLCICREGFRSYDNGRVCEQESLPVRLSQGGLAWGRLEVSNQGQWGTVCLRGWDFSDAEVACKELGFRGSYGTFRADAVLDTSSKPVWLDSLMCTGTEKSLGSCKHGRWKKHECMHDLDVGLICNDVVTSLQFELTLDIPWGSEYENANSAEAMSLRQDLQDMFSDIFVEHSSSNGLGSVDVYKLRVGKDGSMLADMEVMFEYTLDVTSQSLATFFLVDVVKEEGGKLRLPSLPVTVSITSISVKSRNSQGKIIDVALDSSDRCTLFNIKNACLIGSHCVVEGTIPKCKCPEGREGQYCERVPALGDPIMSTDSKNTEKPLTTAQHRVVVSVELKFPWKPAYTDKANKATIDLEFQLMLALDRLYRNTWDNFVRVSIMELYPSDRGVGMGHTHVAEFSRDLGPHEQTEVAMRLLNKIDENDGKVQVNNIWCKVLWGPVLRFTGDSDTTFSEVPITSPCSIYDAQGLCQNNGYCVVDRQQPKCLCDNLYSGKFCEKDAEDENHKMSAASTGTFIAVLIAIILAITVLFLVTLLIMWKKGIFKLSAGMVKHLFKRKCHPDINRNFLRNIEETLFHKRYAYDNIETLYMHIENRPQHCTCRKIGY